MGNNIQQAFNQYKTEGLLDDENFDYDDFEAGYEAAINNISDTLKECIDYFDERADAEYETDNVGGSPNEEMRLMMTLKKILEEI